MTARKGLRASDKFMALLTANVLGNIIKNASANDAFKTFIEGRERGLLSTNITLADSTNWGSSPERLSSDELRRLAKVVSDYRGVNASGLIWKDSSLPVGDKINVYCELKDGQVPESFVKNWKEHAHSFADGALWSSLATAITAAAELQHRTEQLAAKISRPVAAQKKTFDPAVAKTKLSAKDLEAVEKLRPFFRDRPEYLHGHQMKQIVAALKNAGISFHAQQMCNGIRWCLAHPASCTSSRNASSRRRPSASRR